MRFFFKSRQFKIILTVFISIIVLAIFCFLLGGKFSPQADLAGSVIAPFRTAFTKASQAVTDFVSAFKNGEEALIQNAELESELNSLRSKLADFEKMEQENDFYKKYLDIKDKHPDFAFSPATLISRDENDPFKGFTINSGSTDGIKEKDPVITEAGLVGYVSQVGLSTSKVTTILSPDITLGALDNRTQDSGLLSGSIDTATEGLTGLYNLARSCNVAVGDFVVSSGEGIFPEGLLIGTVQSIGKEKYNTSIYASVEPFVNFSEIRNVMVITEFEGQGGLDPNKK